MLWANLLYVEQLTLIRKAKGLFPEAKEYILPYPPTTILRTDVYDVSDTNEVQKLQQIFQEVLTTDSRNSRKVLLACTNQHGNVALVHMARTGVDTSKAEIRFPVGQDEHAEVIRNILVEAHKANDIQILLDKTSDPDWVPGWEGMPRLVANAEELVRLAAYQTKFDIRDIISRRITYSLEKHCEHMQATMRPVENTSTFMGNNENRMMIQTFSNVFRLGQIFTDEELIIKPRSTPDSTKWMKCKPGERSVDGQQWWYSEHNNDKDFSSFAALINMNGDWMENIWRAQKNNHEHEVNGPTHKAKVKNRFELDPADPKAEAYTNQEMIDMLSDYTKEWKHDWTRPPQYPLKYDEEKFDELFQKTGIAVMQFVKGKELQDMRKKAIKRATEWPKFAISNETEVIRRKTIGKGKKAKSANEWIRVAADYGRMQTPLPPGEDIPAKKFIEEHCPRTISGRGDKKMMAKLNHQAMLLQHQGAAAQHLHWDFPALSDEKAGRIPGSLMLALWTTRIVICPMSHRWSLLWGVENGDTSDEDDRASTDADEVQSKLFAPVFMEIPEGAVIYFSALLHGGYGVWALDETLFRPVPSMDDMMQTRIKDLEVRYHAHIVRSKTNTDAIPKSIDPTKTARGEKSPEATYFDFDHRKHLVLLYPPVFTSVQAWTKQKLVYEKRFLDAADIPQEELASTNPLSVNIPVSKPGKVTARSDHKSDDDEPQEQDEQGGGDVNSEGDDDVPLCEFHKQRPASGMVTNVINTPSISIPTPESNIILPPSISKLQLTTTHIATPSSLAKPTIPVQVPQAPTVTSIRHDTPQQPAGQKRGREQEEKDDVHTLEQRTEKRTKLAESYTVPVHPSLKTDIQQSEVPMIDITPAWYERQIDVRDVLHRCPCLEEWFDVFVGPIAAMESWRDRLTTLVSNMGSDAAEALVRQVVSVAGNSGNREVPTKLAWGMALNRERLIDDDDFERLVRASVQENQVLYIAVLVSSLLGEQIILIAKQRDSVNVWMQQEDHVKKEKIIHWFNEVFAQSRSATYAWFIPTVVAAWWEEPLDNPEYS
jgi:hypothetical protein